MAEIKEAKVSDLVFDDKNFNRHTEFGMSLLEKSLRQNGAGRSILIDKNNRIIGGNGVIETASQIGMEDVIIVPSDGKKIIAVQRNDIDLDTEQGRKMALADNATASADLQWDFDNLNEVANEFDIDMEEWGVFLPTNIDPDEYFEEANESHKTSENIIIALPQELLSQKEEIKSVVAECLKPYAGAKIK